MIIAIDAYYTEHSARTVGVLFQSWSDAEPHSIITADTGRPCEYEPGYFYKRELPCIQNLLEQVDLAQIQVIVIDGYVYLDDNKKPGLGHYVYTFYEGRIPVIGVAKNSFRDNEAHVKKLCRGASRRPLYITCAGMELDAAAACIARMHGEHRLPHLLKLLDARTKEKRTGG